MKRPRALIAEDEPVLRDELRQALARLWPELEVVAEAEDGVQAVQALERHRPEVVFLDIEMPGLNGLEVATVASGRCHVTFVTAYDQYAVAAFERGAVDYLLKPWTLQRVATCVARLRERLDSAPAPLEGLMRQLAEQRGPRSYLRWLSVAVGRSLQLITCEEICYFQADNKYTLVVTANSQPLISKTIRQLLTELDPDMFVQIHRSTVVNVQAIAAIDRDLRGAMTVRLKARPERLPVSATFAPRFRHL